MSYYITVVFHITIVEDGCVWLKKFKPMVINCVLRTAVNFHTKLYSLSRFFRTFRNIKTSVDQKSANQ